MLEVFYTIMNSRVDNVRVGITPDRNQLLFQFINALDACRVNMFLNGRPYMTVNWVEVWAVWRSKVQRNKVWLLSTQQFDVSRMQCAGALSC